MNPGNIQLLLLALSAVGCVHSPASYDDGQRPLLNLRSSNSHLPESSLPLDNQLHDNELSICVPIHQPVCRNLQYTKTKFPNALTGLATQDEASKRMLDYQPLIDVGCSNYLRFFLCTVYFPMCSPTLQAESDKTLQPCRALCRYVQLRCEPVLRGINLVWPDELDCDRLPDSTRMCIAPESYELDEPEVKIMEVPSTDRENRRSGTQAASSDQIGPGQLIPELDRFWFPTRRKNDNDSKVTSELLPSSFECLPFELALPSHQHHSSSQGESNYTCVQKCHATLLYPPSAHQLAHLWNIGLAAFSFTACLLILSAFLLDRKRFSYPLRPIVYISLCHLCQSAGLLTRLFVSRNEMICRSQEQNFSSTPILLLQTTSTSDAPPWCILSFFTSYYFSQSSYLWWFIVSLTWFLSASCQWAIEAIETYSFLFHLLSWSLPAISSIIAVALRQLEGDELTGYCQIGSTNQLGLIIFHIAPQIVCITGSCVFLTSGFVAIKTFKKGLKKTPNQPFYSSLSKMDKLVVRIALLTLLYLLPTLLVLGINLYLLATMSRWMSSFNDRQRLEQCLTSDGINWSSNDPQCKSELMDKLPSVEARMLQTFASNVVGISLGGWVWANRKTIDAGSRMINKLLTCRYLPRMTRGGAKHERLVRTGAIRLGHPDQPSKTCDWNNCKVNITGGNEKRRNDDQLPDTFPVTNAWTTSRDIGFTIENLPELSQSAHSTQFQSIPSLRSSSSRDRVVERTGNQCNCLPTLPTDHSSTTWMQHDHRSSDQCSVGLDHYNRDINFAFNPRMTITTMTPDGNINASWHPDRSSPSS